MICYNSNDNINKVPCVVAMGNFDGVHRGHMHLLSKAREYAKENGLAFGIYTFDVHPLILRDNSSFKLLSAKEQRTKLFEKTGADFVYFEDFLSVKAFDKDSFAEYLCEKFGVEAVFCGENFRYARDASGSSDTLCEDMEKLGRKAFKVKLFEIDDESVCSSRIRKLLEDGEAEKAAILLGYEFCIEGEVLHGNNIGHTIGFPTVNLKISDNLVCPKFGVYASRVYVNGKEYKGVTNVGIKPTVVQTRKTVLAETNIFGFNGDIYGEQIAVCLCKMLRSEKRFPSFEALRDAIDNDIKNATEYFGENKYE